MRADALDRQLASTAASVSGARAFSFASTSSLEFFIAFYFISSLLDVRGSGSSV